MPDLHINVTGPADRLLFEGLPYLQPAIEELGDGAMLIGGLATATWIEASDIGLPMRATHDVDLGIDRRRLRLSANSKKVQPLLRQQGFEPLVGDQQFRFVRDTAAGEFLVDLLVAPGASREDPPLLEADLASLAAPGLAYAILRRPTVLALTIVDDKDARRFELPIVKLDAAFVMKGALSAGGRRLKPDRRITDTSDAVMLAAACTADESSVTHLREHRRRKDVRAAIRWLAESFGDAKTAAARRVERHFESELGQSGGGAWAITASKRFMRSLESC